jgi:uncharacterized membrane-anchored protein YhcB (DUF1043 family)
MKKTTFLAALSLIITTFATAISAQNLPKEVFDAEGCGCASIDIDKILSGDTTSVNINNELLVATFVQNKNDKARDVIIRFTDSNAGISLPARIAEMNKSIGPKKDGEKERWIAEFTQVAQKATPKNMDKIRAYMACQFAQNLHSYYIKYPEEAGNTDAVAFYQRYANMVVPIPKADTSKKNDEKIASDGTPDIASIPLDTEASGTPWLWIIIGIGSALVAAYLFASRPQDKTLDIMQLQKDLEQAKAELQKAKEKLAEKEREVENLTRLNTELKNMVAYLEKERQQKIAVNTNPNTQQHHIAINNTQQQNNAAAPLRRYLYAPSMDGTFASNSIKLQSDSEAFYTLELESETSHAGKFKLILDANVVRRAEAMAQQYLLPACDLKGAGRLPQDLSTVKMTAGELVRDGQGWRVSKKISLVW